MVDTIMQVDEFLLINRYTQTFLGLWPAKFEKKSLSVAYTIYRMIAVPFNVSFLLTFWGEVIRTPLKDISKLLEGAGTGVLYSVTIVKLYYCSSNLAYKLIDEIYEEERKLTRTNQAQWVKVWQQQVKYNRWVAKLLEYIGLIVYIPYLIIPLYDKFYSTNALSGNESVVPDLPFKFYVPFDVKRQYAAAFIYQTFGGLYATVSVCSSDTLLVAFMVFCTCQCKMLQESMIRFGEELDSGMEEKVLEECVVVHKKIIRIAGDLNNLVSPLMLLEFITSSLHLSVLLLEVIVNDFDIKQFSILQLTGGMIVQIMYFYWHANELIVESTAISNAIYASKWYNCRKRTKHVFQIIMMRAQKPLTLYVGPFYVMTTQTALVIFKTAYSYLALLYNTHNH